MHKTLAFQQARLTIAAYFPGPFQFLLICHLLFFSASRQHEFYCRLLFGVFLGATILAIQKYYRGINSSELHRQPPLSKLLDHMKMRNKQRHNKVQTIRYEMLFLRSPVGIAAFRLFRNYSHTPNRSGHAKQQRIWLAL